MPRRSVLASSAPPRVSWRQGELARRGAVKEEPTAYHINLDGFQSDRDEGFFLGHDDIDMEATKTKPWEGELVIVLKVNDTLVQCDTMRETSPRDYPGDVSIAFDADSRKDYKKQAVCTNRLES